MKSASITMTDASPRSAATASRLAFRFVLPVSLLVIVISVVLTFVVTKIARERLTSALEERAQSLAQDLAYNSELGVLSAQKNLLQGPVGGILRQEDILYVQIVGDTKVLLEQEKTKYNGILQERERAKIRREDTNPQVLHLTFPSRPFEVLEASTPVYTVKKERSREEIGLDPLSPTRAQPEEQKQIGTVRIGVSMARIARTIDNFIQTIAILTVFTIVLITLVVGWTILRVVVHPVRRLATSMEEVSAGDLGIQVPVEGDDEIAQLTGSFNAMALSLKAAHEELEQRVRERTRDLQQEVTVRKQAEERITRLNEDLQRRAAELQEAVGQLESFSYSISHDLRAPLRAIDGYSKAVLEEYEGRVDPEGKRLLTVIRNNAVMMGQLIDDLLAFSRLGRQEVKRSLIHMTQLAHTVFEDLNHETRNRKIDIQIDTLPDTLGDLSMMRQVYRNLLSNAIKFTGKKDLGMIHVGSRVEDTENIYFVRDNGIGFDMQYSNKLFGVFRRLTNAEDFEGTGVGLAIVQGIIQKHGGRVWAEGQPGSGSTFFFALPRKTNGE